jgi:molybdopterin-containing oxidoreductase family iron-sulfur binding subunit
MNENYWRSLGELNDSPSFRQNLEREFPEGASELPEGVAPRMLIPRGVAVARRPGLVPPSRRKIVPYVTAPEIVPGVPRRYATRCRSDGRLRAGRRKPRGRPTKIRERTIRRQRPLERPHAASILGLYDPDRAQQVTRREARRLGGFRRRVDGHDKKHLEDGGALLALLTPSFARRLAPVCSMRSASGSQGAGRVYEPVSDENVLAAAKSSAGRPPQPVYDVEKPP